MNVFFDLRKRAGITQEDAAKALGVNRSTVAKWETEKASPRAGMVPKLARLYNCTPNDLFREMKEAANGSG